MFLKKPSFSFMSLFSRVDYNWGSVAIVPCLQDNYAYIVQEKETDLVVDPVEPERVMQCYAEMLQPKGTLRAIWTTHHHWDHAGGNKKLLEMVSNQVDVYGADERIEGLTFLVKDQHLWQMGSISVRTLLTPCHTTGSACFLVSDRQQTSKYALFSGDTLFIAGCGRFFEGNATQMHEALQQLTKDGLEKDQTALETDLYPGHEYTTSNLQFALHVEPENEKIKEMLEWSKKQTCTVPSNLALELQVNPFVRVALHSDPVARMAALREQKNNFRS